MSLLIDDEDTVAAIRRLAGETGRSEADVVRMAVEAEAQRAEEAARRHRAIRSLQDEVGAGPRRAWRRTRRSSTISAAASDVP